MRRLHEDTSPLRGLEDRQGQALEQHGPVGWRPGPALGAEEIEAEVVEVVDDEEQRPPPFVADAHASHDHVARLGLCDRGMLANLLEKRRIDSGRNLERRRGGSGAQVARSDLAVGHGVRTEDGPDRDEAHGDGGDHQEHAAPLHRDVANELPPAGAKHGRAPGSARARLTTCPSESVTTRSATFVTSRS
jgi:hypothetical protein